MPRARQRNRRPQAQGEVFGDHARALVYHETTTRLAASGSALPPLPPGWTIEPAEGGGVPRFANVEGSTIVDPRFLPRNWEMRLDDSGTPYFISHEFQGSTYVDPRGLPPGWRLMIEQVEQVVEGRACFASDDGGFTTFIDPRGLPDNWELRSFESLVCLALSEA